VCKQAANRVRAFQAGASAALSIAARRALVCSLRPEALTLAVLHLYLYLNYGNGGCARFCWVV